MDNVDFAIVGCGYWGSNIARVFSALKLEHSFTGNVFLYDLDSKKARTLAKKYDFEVADSYDEILNSPTVDAILIVTPSSSHYDLTKKGLEAGKNVFVEKPVTLDSSKASELHEISKSVGKKLMIGLIFRYHQGILNLKERIRIGEFGDIHYMLGYKFGYSIPKEDTGAMFTLAVNDFDTMCFLNDCHYPKSINAQKGVFVHPTHEELATVELEFENNTKSYFINTWLMPVFERLRQLIIVGSKKTAKIDYLRPNEILIYNSAITRIDAENDILFDIKKGTPQKVVFPFKEPLYEEMKHFVSCIVNDEQPKTDGLVGYRSIKMCEIGLKSAKNGRKIQLTGAN